MPLSRMDLLRESILQGGRQCAVPLQVMLVAVHPWDCNGAKAAGLKTAYIAREGQQYPGYFLPPDYVASSLEDLAWHLKL